jgi:predicted TIM-barrel fold metal-dependent hydrolase
MATTENKGHVDMHVHVVGNGLRGSGCWYRLNWYRRRAAEFMLWCIGYRGDLDDADFDVQYGNYLATRVRESSLSHAVILAHEEVYHEDGGKMDFGSFHVSNDHVLWLGREHPDFLPAVSIHPARKDACQELERCVAGGAVMVKILPPSQNIDCSRPQYRDFFKLMADLRLPLLAHSGGEYTVPVVDKKLFSPQLFRQPLECGVTVIAAHFATRSGPKFMEKDYLPGFLKMLREYPHLFGDNSALNTLNRSHGLRTCLESEWMARTLHGSDFPVPVSGHWARFRSLLQADQVREAHRTPNILERDYQLKRAMGFSDSTFTRIWDLIPTSRPA